MKTDLGLGVMISLLGGNKETLESIRNSLGKTIRGVVLSEDEDDALLLEFDDNTALKLWDDGQCCCESRYMRTDDNLSDFFGSVLLNIELNDAPSIDGEYEEHEIQFLDIHTDKGVFTISNHNEHNGYYGGFAIRAKLLTK